MRAHQGIPFIKTGFYKSGDPGRQTPTLAVVIVNNGTRTPQNTTTRLAQKRQKQSDRASSKLGELVAGVAT